MAAFLSTDLTRDSSVIFMVKHFFDRSANAVNVYLKTLAEAAQKNHLYLSDAMEILQLPTDCPERHPDPTWGPHVSSEATSGQLFMCNL